MCSMRRRRTFIFLSSSRLPRRPSSSTAAMLWRFSDILPCLSLLSPYQLPNNNTQQLNLRTGDSQREQQINRLAIWRLHTLSCCFVV